MEYKTREYPLFAACGLNCGLCPRYHTDSSSRCPGCAGKGFSEAHPSCGVLSCCQRKGIEYCFLCEEYPCKRYDGVDSFDSFITHKNQLRDLEKAKQMGIEVYKAELDEKVKALKKLLKNYNDGRRKSFFCLAVSLLELHDIKATMEQIAAETKLESQLKTKAAIAVRCFEEKARAKDISLKLRKKTEV